MFGLWFGDSHLGFGTHLPILASAVLQARPGPVVEYGAGLYSTPLLHMLCREMGRKLLTLDSDAAWIERFADLRHDDHQLCAFPDWTASEALVDAKTWAVAFIDHGPDERRPLDIKRLTRRAEFVLVHDWNEPGGLSVQPEILDLFRYHWVSKVRPRTVVLSNVRPFKLEVF